MAVYPPFQILVYLFEVITKVIFRSSVDNILKEQSVIVKVNVIQLQN